MEIEEDIQDRSEEKKRVLHRPKHKRGKRYERLGTLPVDEVMPLVGKVQVDFFGYTVRMDTPPLKCFKAHGTKCQICGLEAKYFVVEYDPLTAVHIMLVGIENDHEVLFTRDHIRPVSAGGSNGSKNLRTCCAICNQILGRIHSAQVDLMKRMGVKVPKKCVKEQGQRPTNKKGRWRVEPPYGLTLRDFWPDESGETDRMEVEEEDGRHDA